MANSEKAPVSFQQLVISSLAQTDALSKLLIEKGIITQQEFFQNRGRTSDISAHVQPNAAVKGMLPFSPEIL